MEKNSFWGIFAKFYIYELAFVVAAFLAVSILRYFSEPLFSEIMEVYNEYVNTEITLDLVLG